MVERIKDFGSARSALFCENTEVAMIYSSNNFKQLMKTT